MPNVIKEVFMPPSVPRDIESRNEIATRIESALVYQNSGNYDMAVKALEEAREMWQIKQNNGKYQKILQEVKAAAGTGAKTGSKPNAMVDIQKAKEAEEMKKEMMKDLKLQPIQELYFDMSLGSIYESMAIDDLAIECYMKALDIKLPTRHPDAAFAYCGLGSVMYHIDEPAWALRCYLQAR